MRTLASAFMFCSLLLTAQATLAQKARCVDTNGKGNEAIMHGQSMHSGQQLKRQELKLDSTIPSEEGRHMFAWPSSGGSTHESIQKRLELKLDSAIPNEEGRHMFARPSSGGSTHESIQKRLEQMDAAAAAARSGPGAGPRPQGFPSACSKPAAASHRPTRRLSPPDHSLPISALSGLGIGVGTHPSCPACTLKAGTTGAAPGTPVPLAASGC
ncbi:hypothetical protein [Comamonas sp. C24C]